MITVGSVSREEAAERAPFLAPRYRRRRRAIREVTHTDPELVFWIMPDGRFLDARDSHLANPPKGHDHILDDKPEYGGFLRGRVARYASVQLVVVYCRPEALATDADRIIQFVRGTDAMPVPLEPEALVVSDNADLYGTLADLRARAEAHSDFRKRGRGTAT